MKHAYEVFIKFDGYQVSVGAKLPGISSHQKTIASYQHIFKKKFILQNFFFVTKVSSQLAASRNLSGLKID